MDFGKILHENLTGAALPERLAYYDALRAQLHSTLERNGHGPESEIARNYSAKLETAITAFNAEQAGAALPAAEENAHGPAIVSTHSDDKTSSMSTATSESISQPKPSSGTGFGTIAAIFIAGSALGYFASGFLGGASTGAASTIASHIQSETPKFERNLSHLKKMESALKQAQQRSGRYPVSDSFAAFIVVVKDNPAFIEAIAPEGVSHDRLYYKSNGRDFKLMYNRSGDCFVARIKNPELLDADRASGPVDCQDYGVWSEGGKSF
jgi:hypothetical protein